MPIKNNTKEKKQSSLSVLMVASEMYPYAKVGGLADVVWSLSAALKKRGLDVRVVIPRYSSIDLDKYKLKVCLEPMGVWMGTKEEWCTVYETRTPADVPVYMIEHKNYFHRQGLYHDNAMNDYDDNGARFGFLSRAALQLCKDLNFKPDIIHGNDWQTALAAAYLKIWHWNDPVLGGAASVITLHNIAYQGIYSKNVYEYLGLGWQNFTEEIFESYDKVNLLKGGIYYADMVTGVSPSFVKEITQPFGGFGLSPYLNRKGANFVGILNGADYSIWDPAHDSHISANYSISDMKGKAICKRDMQKVFNLKQDSHVACIGAIGRFVEQKGFRLLAECIEGLLQNMHIQFVIVGSGEQDLEKFFGELPARYPGRVGSFIGFDDRSAHLLEAGCDFFIMPSLFEPCGLNQLYSLRYGTLPIVHATGGLDDTVVNYEEATGNGNGFKFWEASSRALYFTIGWAVSTYYDRPHHLKAMIKRAMQEDHSWDRSAEEYENIYKKAIENKKHLDSGYRPYYW